jgi:glycosyltransferase involved in cell wall biosynthesis
MTEPLVSIITPTYNHEAFISNCIRSVLAQSYRNWELIVVDDGSSDGTWDTVQRLAANDRRIHPHRQERRGIWRLSETYNFALSRASGSLIAVLEGDDYWPPYKLATQVRYHQGDPDLLLCYGQVGLVRNGKQVALYPSPGLTGRHPSAGYLRLALLRTAALMSISIVVKRAALEAAGGFSQPDGFPAVDLPTWLRVVQQPGTVVYIEDVLGYWQHHDTQVTYRMGVELAESALDLVLDQFRALPAGQKAALGITERDIILASRTSLSNAYFARLRSALLARDRVLVRSCIPAVWKYGDAKRRVQAIYSLIAQRWGWDMEWILGLYEHVMVR